MSQQIINDSQGPGTGTVRLTTGQAIVRFLQKQYSERDGKRRRLIQGMFGIFGHGNVAGLGQALYEYGQDLPYCHSYNEQSMVHTAIGFAKTHQRLATLACSSSIGPGSTNMITGAATATVNRLPVLLLPSDYYATRHQGVVMQQLEHPISSDVSVNDCFRPVSRFFDRISRPEQLLSALPEAMRVLIDPIETGAVTLSLPEDVQSHAYDFPTLFLEERTWRIIRAVPDSESIREAVGLLKKARRPMIIAGGGANYSQAGKVLQSFAEQFGIPVTETYGGRSVIQSDSDLFLGGFGTMGTAAAAKIARNADLILCVGTRLTDIITASRSIFQNPDVRFISINVCSRDAYKEGSLPLIGDAKATIEILSTAVAEADLKPNSTYIHEVAEVKREWNELLRIEAYQPIIGQAMGQGELISILNQAARDGDTIVAAAGTCPGELHRVWDATQGRNLNLELGYSCMGHEIPSGVGIRMAKPESEVFVLIGDGTYLMNPTDLVTALQENLKITVVISDNHGYQSIRGLQMGRVGRDFGNEFRARNSDTNRLEGEYLDLDLAMTARGFGARTWRVKTREELQEAIDAARLETKTCVIVVETERYRRVPSAGTWWDVAPAEATNDPVTLGLRKEYEHEVKSLQKFYYWTNEHPK